jgi:hypothetical protein
VKDSIPEKILITQTKEWLTPSVAAYRKIGDNRHKHKRDKESDRVKDGWNFLFLEMYSLFSRIRKRN